MNRILICAAQVAIFFIFIHRTYAKACERGDEVDDKCINHAEIKGTVQHAKNCESFEKLSYKHQNFDTCSIDAMNMMENLVCCPTTYTPAPGVRAKEACENFISKYPEARIIDGEEAGIGEFPHFASLAYKNEKDKTTIIFQCGGALISANFVLSAAHCNKITATPIFVRLGRVS